MAGDTENNPTARPASIGASGGSWYAWWHGDPLPALAPLPGLVVELVTDDQLIVRVTDFGATEVQTLLHDGHRLYVARLNTTPVAHGWSATATASIGEIGVSLTLPPRNHYLWGFETGPAWRGRGIYPRLLQAILTAEMGDVDRYWIGHEPENAASARGILKAGFQRVGDLFFLADGGLGLLADGAPSRAAAAAGILGVRQLMV